MNNYAMFEEFLTNGEVLNILKIESGLVVSLGNEDNTIVETSSFQSVEECLNNIQERHEKELSGEITQDDRLKWVYDEYRCYCFSCHQDKEIYQIKKTKDKVICTFLKGNTCGRLDEANSLEELITKTKETLSIV